MLNIYLDVNTAWGDKPMPRFYMTNPVLWNGDFTSSNIPEGQDNPLPDDLPDYVDKYNYAVYYKYDETTKANIYKIYVEDEQGDDWKTYKYEIMVPFGIDITREWTSKNYMYGIFLMGGILYIDQMVSTVAEYIMEEQEISGEDAYDIAAEMTEEQLYQYILDYSNKDNPKPLNKVAKIDGREVIIDRSDDRWSPYWTVDYDYPMLNPSKITVNNDPIGGII